MDVKLNHYLKTLLKKVKMSNILEFSLKDRKIDLIAEIFDIERNDGSRFVSKVTSSEISRHNNYLDYQFRRLIKYAKNNELDKFNYLGKKLIQKSLTFRNSSLFFVFPKWYTMDFVKLQKLYLKIDALCKPLSTELKYKRVWIDKKVKDDYGRPLGVPEGATRVYLNMITRITEIYIYAKELNNPAQHGGVSGKGVMTCLQELVKELKRPEIKYVYEFDIKGFFDHVSHDSILENFKGTFLHNIFSVMLKAKPYDYKIPPEEKDEVTSIFEMMKLPSVFDKLFTPVLIEEEGEMSSEFKKDLAKINELYKERNKKSFSDVYSNIKKGEDIIIDRFPGNGFRFQDLELPTFEGRSLGRDKWKDLHLEDQGVPQGTSFGPVLASLVLGQTLRDHKCILYVDDGLVFLRGAMTPDLELEKIKCSIEPSKTRLLEKVERTTNFKFLGVRFIQQSRNFFTMRSETRKGISKLLIGDYKDITSSQLVKLIQNKVITVSKKRVLLWYYQNTNLLRLFSDTMIDVSIRRGFFGKILSDAYSPTRSLEEMKDRIEKGMAESKVKILNSKGSLGEFLFRKKRIEIENYDEKINVLTDLNNLSTLAQIIWSLHLRKKMSKFYFGLVSKKIRKNFIKKLRKMDKK